MTENKFLLISFFPSPGNSAGCQSVWMGTAAEEFGRPPEAPGFLPWRKSSDPVQETQTAHCHTWHHPGEQGTNESCEHFFIFFLFFIIWKSIFF